jgi:preprotein translocase subunit SecG
MIIVILVIHVMLTVSLIGVVLLQKSEGGGLGIGGSSGGGMSGFMTGRSTANLLTRTTAILAAGFMVTSILLAVLHAHEHGSNRSILDATPATEGPAQNAAPADQPKPAAPAEMPTPPPASGVPLAK